MVTYLLKIGVKKKWFLFFVLKILGSINKTRHSPDILSFLKTRLILTPENCIEELVKTGWTELIVDTIKFLSSNKANCLPVKGNYTTWEQLVNQAWVHDVKIFLDRKIKSGSKNTSEYKAIWEAILK